MTVFKLSTQSSLWHWSLYPFEKHKERVYNSFCQCLWDAKEDIIWIKKYPDIVYLYNTPYPASQIYFIYEEVFKMCVAYRVLPSQLFIRKHSIWLIWFFFYFVSVGYQYCCLTWRMGNKPSVWFEPRHIQVLTCIWPGPWRPSLLSFQLLERAL